MLGHDQFLQLRQTFPPGFQNQQHLRAALDPSLPPVMRFNSRDQVGASDQPRLQRRVRQPPRRFQIRRRHQYNGEIRRFHNRFIHRNAFVGYRELILIRKNHPHKSMRLPFSVTMSSAVHGPPPRQIPPQTIVCGDLFRIRNKLLTRESQRDLKGQTIRQTSPNP